MQSALFPVGDERLNVAGKPAVVLERIEGEEGPNYSPPTRQLPANYLPTEASDAYVETAAAGARLVAMNHVSAMGLEELHYREPPWLTNLAAWKTELDMALRPQRKPRHSRLSSGRDRAPSRLQPTVRRSPTWICAVPSTPM